MASSSSTNLSMFDKLPSELRTYIDSFLKDDRTTLSSAIRVSKEWYDRLVDLLWYEPGYGALLCPDECRRQFYANKIHAFVLDAGMPVGFQNGAPMYWSSVLSGLKMSNLRKLEVKGLGPFMHDFEETERIDIDVYVCNLLNPTLPSLKFQEGLNSTILHSLLKCQQLRHLSFTTCVFETDTFAAFFEFLEHHPCLRSIHFEEAIICDTGTRPPIDNTLETIAYLLKHGRLSEIRLGKQLTEIDAAKLVDLLVNPLGHNKDLVSLDIVGHQAALNLLLSTASGTLQTLEITFAEEYDGDVVRHLSRFMNLDQLRLSLYPEQNLPQDEFRSLGGLSSLKVLKIDSLWESEDPPALDWLTDEIFSECISKLPALRVLDLQIDCKLTGSSVTAIGRACRHLEECTLGWTQNLNSWKTSTGDNLILFPKLRKLVLREVVSFVQNIEPDTQEAVMRQTLPFFDLLFVMAPCLERLEFIYADSEPENDGAEALQTTMRTITGHSCHPQDPSWSLSKGLIVKYKEDQRLNPTNTPRISTWPRLLSGAV